MNPNHRAGSLEKWLIADINEEGTNSMFWAAVEAYTPEAALEWHLKNPSGSSTHAERLEKEGEVRFVVARKTGEDYGTSVSISQLYFFTGTRTVKTVETVTVKVSK